MAASYQKRWLVGAMEGAGGHALKLLQWLSKFGIALLIGSFYRLFSDSTHPFLLHGFITEIIGFRLPFSTLTLLEP